MVDAKRAGSIGMSLGRIILVCLVLFWGSGGFESVASGREGTCLKVMLLLVELNWRR